MFTRAAFACAVLFAAVTSYAVAPVVDPPFAPIRYKVNGGEYFLGLHGNALSFAGSETTVIFSGAVGTFEMVPNAMSYTSLSVWVPSPIINQYGMYNVRVRTSGGTSNAIEFEVRYPPGAILQVPPSTIIQQATSRDGAHVEFTVTASSPADGSPLPVTCDHQPGDLYPFGSTVVRCSAMDETGLVTEGLVGILVVDFVGPRIDVPEEVVKDATGPDGAVVEYEVTADDVVDGAVEVRCTPASGTTFPLGTTEVRCEATDAHLNRSVAAFNVTVVEPHQSPILHLPEPLIVEASGPGGTVVTFEAYAEPAAPVTCAPASGSLFPLGTTAVECAADGITGSFTITVEDTTPPVLVLPDDIITSDPVVTFTATASDLVDGSVGVTCTPASGATFPSGGTTVRCSAMDAHGNTALGLFHVNVVSPDADTTPPVVTSISVTPEVLSPPNHKLIPVEVFVSAEDDTDPDPLSRVIAVSCNEPMDPSDWRVTGPLTLELRAERSGQSPERLYAIQVETSDASGNVTLTSVTVRVPHDSKDSSPAVQPPAPRRRSTRH
jgi:hypothetical protein